MTKTLIERVIVVGWFVFLLVSLLIGETRGLNHEDYCASVYTGKIDSCARLGVVK